MEFLLILFSCSSNENDPFFGREVLTIYKVCGGVGVTWRRYG